MSDAAIFFLSVIALVIWYYIIRGAVSSANAKQREYLKLLIRLRITEMQRAGFSNQEITDLVNMDDDHFIKSLATPTEKTTV